MRAALYTCTQCGAPTLLCGREQVRRFVQVDEGHVQPLGACDIGRVSTYDGKLITCGGEMEFQGWVYIAEPVDFQQS